MVESQAIYDILEHEIVPLFYTRSADNLPRAWICKMKNSIEQVTPRFNTDRMVGDYARRFYNPAVARWRYLTGQDMSKAKTLAMWKSNLKSLWPEFSIKDVKIEVNNGQADVEPKTKLPQLKVGSEFRVRALVKLGGVSPDDVSVELYHGSVDARGNIKDGSVMRMAHKERSEQDGEHWFAGSMVCTRTGQQGVAVRLLPRNSDMVEPYELGLILWEALN
jgi:starch phosphorylase